MSAKSVPSPYHKLSSNEEDGLYIRLVKIHTIEKESGQPIECSIAEFKLSECPAYDAVSYVWGPPTDISSVLCNNVPTNVPSNLHAFLLRCRPKAANRFFWIDSICINQIDKAEKASQVAEMRNIYRAAKRTIVWLGVEADNSTLALKFAAKLSEALDADAYSKKSRWYRFRAYSERSAVFTNHWSAFFKLLDRAWFSRAWIVQEVALSKNTWVLCGPANLSWAALCRALYYIVQHQVWILEFYGSPNIAVLMALHTSHHEVEKGMKRRYWEVLLRHRQSLASNPRDHVYAYYGLSSHESFKDHLILPNYETTSTLKGLYAEVAVSTLRTATNLEFLNVPRLKRDDGLNMGLASWIPDWSCSTNLCSSFLYFEMLHSEDFRLPYRTTMDSTFTPTINEVLSQLHVSGYIIDRLECVSSAWELQDTSGYSSIRKQAMILQKNQAFIHDWEATIGVRIHPNAPYPTGEELEEAVWQTLVAGLAAASEASVRPLYYKFRSRQVYLLKIHRWGLDDALWVWVLVVIFGHVLRFLGIPNPEMGFRALTGTMINRKIAKTEKGYIGLVPGLAEEDDYVVLLKGGKLPFVLRPRGSEWEFIGDAYVHGVTNGELWIEEKCSDMTLC